MEIERNEEPIECGAQFSSVLHSKTETEARKCRTNRNLSMLYQKLSVVEV